MRNTLLLIALVIAAATPANAAAITLKINNKTGAAITSIVATPKGGGADISLTATPIAEAITSPISFTQPAGNPCVFTLTTTLSTAKIISNPDTDLCQTDMIVVQ
jgi:hypothetical protein